MLVVFVMIGCDDYLDINQDPNGAAEPPIAGLLANATYNSAINVYRFGYRTSYLTQYMASPNQGSMSDTHQRVNTDNLWTNIYDISSDIYDMIYFAQESGSNEYIGVGNILMALNIGMAVDVYGDMPYSEAFNFETITPAYDKDEELYNQIFKLLDDAISELNKDNEGVALDQNSDFIHDGDIDAWIKTAYALKARYLNHLSKTNKYDPNAILDALSNAYTSNEDDAQLETFKVRNPWSQVARNNDNLELDGWLSEQIIDAMNGTTFGVFDPRLPLLTIPLPDGTFVGTPNGAGRKGDGVVQEEVYLKQDGFYSSEQSPLVLISYSELKFIEAEVNLRSSQSSDAYNAYLEGIRANMEKIGVNTADINSYTGNSVVAVGASNLSLNTVFKEKYVTMFLHPESWVDVRRNDYDYKDFDPPQGMNSDLGGKFSRRMDYPDTERQRNSQNIPSVDLLTPIWWDAN